jgi:hypothetical protein
MTEGRIVIIPFLHGKLDAHGNLIEPDIDAIFENWLQRHPQFLGRKFHTIKTGAKKTCLVRVTVDFSPDLADYDPAEDADLYEEFLADKGDSPPPSFHTIWVEQCEAAQGIEDEFGTQKALEYLVGEKFLNFLEAAEANADFRAEIPAFVAKIKEIFEPWQLAEYLERARETEPFDPSLFEPDPLIGEEKIEYDAEEIEDMQSYFSDATGPIRLVPTANSSIHNFWACGRSPGPK